MVKGRFRIGRLCLPNIRELTGLHAADAWSRAPSIAEKRVTEDGYT